MDLKECYESFNGDYADAVRRLGSEKMVSKFLIMYKNDDTMEQLRNAVREDDIEASFVAAHTLKGVAGNLSLKGLADAAIELTEQLRPRTEKADVQLFNKVEQMNELVLEAILEYENSVK